MGNRLVIADTFSQLFTTFIFMRMQKALYFCHNRLKYRAFPTLFVGYLVRVTGVEPAAS